VVAGVRILLAEDNLVNQRVAVAHLGKLGYQADVAENGLAALAALERSHYDLLLLDCQMPELDGFETARRIRSGERGTPGARRLPIIAMTANAMAGDREACLAAGMDDYIAKPVRLEQLGETIRAWLPERFPAPQPADDRAAGPRTGAAASGAPGMELVDSLRKRLADERLVQEVIALFLEQSPRQLAAVAAAVAEGASGRLAESAHLLKGTCLAIEATQLVELAGTLELLGRSGTLDPAGPMVEALARALDATMALLREQRSPPGGPH
jgi:CheY-like chemotaxis protein